MQEQMGIEKQRRCAAAGEWYLEGRDRSSFCCVLIRSVEP